ncbi:adenosylmethionine--8-amino-7-oxononanoate transaminase [Zooshikella harenae]|uniref:Adenosylmethionine-8-amino-7-oxononanoate aminotransferase n=1 Tax=Zooshikella harenae TaxID=2827238 RepID=A0ABS5ZCL7_9GAMM|nr:adenosylmethionine--8-amino-7-oxononanoate transaminase [Zooshikella harenae]MBU2711755.1 adenosylmethionine--8-amino-7-oxononanoate transaminase [Zooshikella harenae]
MTKPQVSEDDLGFDAAHIWHPYTSMQNRYQMFPVVSASGVQLTLNDGRQLVDGMASWWSVIHGYNHPILNAAIQQQLGLMAHVMFGGLTHKPAIDLARKLVAITPEPLQQVFFSDSGSVAVEVAIKMALQYQQAKGNTQKKRLLTVKRGYHGDTFSAMSVCDPEQGMHMLFQGVLTEQLFAPAPQSPFSGAWQPDELAAVKQLFKQHHSEIAAFIIEPIVQGAGGMRFYAAEYLAEISKLCNQYQVLLIADEIATGFGRTGKLFACEHAGVAPDILCVGKALTGGYMSFAATLCTEEVSQVISKEGVLMHGPTFMANPLACSVANASIDLLLEQDWQGTIAQIEQGLTQGLAYCSSLPQVADVRVLGAIGVVELKQPVDMHQVQPMFVEQGIWVRPFGKLVYVMPPYIISKEQLTLLCQGICNVITQLGE